MSYAYLTRTTKRFILEELKRFFTLMPRHKDVEIRYKYQFKERPQKGIVLQNISADINRLSADNYLAGLESFIMQAQLAGFSGSFLEWVREDDLAITRNKGRFPSQPAAHYLTLEQVGDNPDDATFNLYIESLPRIRDERHPITGPIITLDHTPEPGTESLLLSPDFELLPGQGLTLSSAFSLRLGANPLGLPEGPVLVRILGNQGPFLVQAGVNDTIAGTLNGIPFFHTLDPGWRQVQDLAYELEQLGADLGLYPPFFSVAVADDRLALEAESLLFEDSATNTAGPLLGLEGTLSPVVRGYRLPRGLSEAFEWTLSVDNIDYVISLPEGPCSVQEYQKLLQRNIGDLTVTIDEVGDYILSGNQVFLQIPVEPGQELRAFYSYREPTQGPFEVKKENSRNDLIPGAVLAFGQNFVHGDKAVVVVYPQRQYTADLYGGKFNLSLDMDIITRDPMDREDIVDLLLLNFQHYERERLAEEGLAIESVATSGEAEEIYDDNGDDYFFTSGISMSLLADWEISVPRPLTIERVTPVSFSEESRVLGTNLTPLTQLRLPPTEYAVQSQALQAYIKSSKEDLL